MSQRQEPAGLAETRITLGIYLGPKMGLEQKARNSLSPLMAPCASAS